MKDPMLMRLFSSFLFPSLVVLGPVATAIAALLWASVAGAAATYTAVATTSLGNPLNALEIGELVTIDVTLRSDGEAPIGLSAFAISCSDNTTYGNNRLTNNAGTSDVVDGDQRIDGGCVQFGSNFCGTNTICP